MSMKLLGTEFTKQDMAEIKDMLQHSGWKHICKALHARKIVLALECLGRPEDGQGSLKNNGESRCIDRLTRLNDEWDAAMDIPK